MSSIHVIIVIHHKSVWSICAGAQKNMGFSLLKIIYCVHIIASIKQEQTVRMLKNVFIVLLYKVEDDKILMFQLADRRDSHGKQT